IKNLGANFLAELGTNVLPYVKDLAEDALPKVQTALQTAGTYVVNTIIPAAKETMAWISEHSDGLLALAGAVGTAVIAYKAAKAALAIYNTVTSVAKILSITSTAATAAQTGATVAQAAATTGAIAPTTALAVATNALCWPILAVVAAIAAVVAIVILLVRNWDKVKAAAIQVWNTIKSVWGAVATWFNDNVITPLVSFFSPIVETVGGFFSTLWDNIVAVWTMVGTWFNENVAAPINAAFQAVSDFVKGVFNGLMGFVEGMINGVIGAINKFIGGFSGIVGKAAAFIGVDWGGISELPQVSLPRLAAGGIATAPTLAEIGEGGEPEAVLPLSKLAALLDEWTKPKPTGGGSAGGGDGETVMFAPVFNFYGNTTKEEAKEAGRVSFAEFKRLYKQMKAEERRKSFSPA
ncbi:MAG: hypothetical protein RRY97_09100, partial [Oscillibacter sp.]